MVGDTVVSDETESAYIRITGRTGAKYSWVEVYRTPNGTWANTTHTGNTTYDWAVERNNATIPAGSTVYEAKRSPDTSEWVFGQGASGGSFQANSTETAIMILGTYDEYKDCEDVPPKPPTVITDLCTGERGTELCVPSYAYAVYQRCGYVWNKIGDTRTYQVWAQEMNGGTGYKRRLYIPRWGGSMTESGPDPDAACMGLAFLGVGAGSDLSCTCPTCLSSPPPDACLMLKFRTASRPSVYNECGSTVTLFDENDLWDKDIEIPITVLGCTGGGNSGEGVPIFDFEYQFIADSELECDWGPDVFDPCDPCAHWGRLGASINISDDSNVNCSAAGHWRGEFLVRDICNLLCSCTNGPVTPLVSSMCDGCGNNIPPVFYFILPETIEIVCCPTSEGISGGNATSNFTSAYYGGNATSSFTEAVYGGSEE